MVFSIHRKNLIIQIAENIWFNRQQSEIGYLYLCLCVRASCQIQITTAPNDYWTSKASEETAFKIFFFLN